ncbi:MAG: DMT family transporter [Flavobacteriia bacterium]|nr:DMT family transporter [Flavobacteriia bacterium]OIP46270.1 MAG: EamA family transporter [Flavobacteriaceae bacterium CG2_30_31_66]PIV95950.1 MAG: EamA family transporter [Flavobacteriaceae bacterium CG17_big_fil_post_rev_8_21_14_2_50_31_13]PIX13560.1 MAG: EamA family transporter [Flavobacteriaceae bacterium CG_4_8_14_3_um_filter_31_8]PIY16285.1 MAG: EamA family transporter [Flavobacteriaceae bacterium CG_4_10_14_3_um_filter_31_253]PIZ11946.1 MAG: EamA family transporter [Flavobacteriaceae 
MQNNNLKNLFWLLVAVFLVSTSGVLGRYIALPTEIIIWFRSFLAAIFLYVFLRFKKTDLRVQQQKEYLPFFIGGVFMALHWVTYFYALKLSNVGLGMLSLYTFPVIIALLEPLILKVKFQGIHVFFGILILVGLYILTPKFDIESTQVKGILFGVFSAFCYAFRILILKKHAANYDGTVLMFYQVIIVSILLLPTLFFMDVSGLKTQWPYLLLLAFLTTAVGHSMMLHSLKFFSASTTSIISSLQPIFGIIMAIFFLNEIPTLNTFIGGFLILFTVVIESYRMKK